MSDKSSEIQAKAEEVYRNFGEKWGGFRRYISAHPLTGFWIGVGVGAGTIVGLRLVGRVFGFAASLIF